MMQSVKGKAYHAVLMAVLLVSALVLGGCAGKQEAAKAEPASGEVDRLTAPTPQTEAAAISFGPHLNLEEFLVSRLREQYFSLDNLYEPPPTGFLGRYYIQLRSEPVELHLAEDVVAYSEGGKGLAVATGDGAIHVWSDWSCPGVAVPGKGGVGALSWSPQSPFMAISEQNNKTVRLFDLRRCAQVHAFDPESTVTQLALSPGGKWLALTDEVHNLWIGPAAGEMRVAARLRYEALELAFTPREGVLMVVDQGGWVTLWAPLEGKLVDRIRIPGAPFREASIKGGMLHLTGLDGTRSGFDLVRRVSVAPDGESGRYSVREGVLYYKSWQERPVKSMHLAAPMLLAGVSASAGAIRVQDIDGKLRYYDLTTGAARPPVEAEDWQGADLGRDYGFTAGQQRFVLADPIFQRGAERLFCRHVPGQGFYLWWAAGFEPAELPVREGMLPERLSLRADGEVAWRPLVPSAANAQ